MIKKAVLFCLVLSSSCLINASPSHYKFAVTELANRSAETILLQDYRKIQAVISSLKRKGLKEGLLIPFISTQKYHDQFIRDIPYIPQYALLVKAQDDTFGIWENETGIVYARVYEQGKNSPDDCLETILIKAEVLLRLKQSSSYSEQALARIIRFLLIIDHNGQLKIEHKQLTRASRQGNQDIHHDIL